MATKTKFAIAAEMCSTFRWLIYKLLCKKYEGQMIPCSCLEQQSTEAFIKKGCNSFLFLVLFQDIYQKQKKTHKKD